MRWTNKGHEYDGVYNNICNIAWSYLFGAGDYGMQFANIYKDEIDILGYIDNNPEKNG